MRTRLITTAAAAVVLGLLGPASSAPTPLIDEIGRTGREDPDDPGCLQIPPEETPPIPADTSKRLPIEMRVMVDPADHELAVGYIANTVAAYARINVAMKVSWDVLPVPPPDPKAEREGRTTEAIFDFMRARYGGKRPKGVDVVYLMTRHWAGGFANCIGGIRDDRYAFAFGSVDYKTEGVVPAPTVDEGLIAAHEVGHLLGGHHHYSNCAEAQPAAGLRGETGTCTVMSPAAGTITGSFSTVETAFVRDYVGRYAKG